MEKKELPVMCWFVNTCEHAEVPPLSVESDTSTRANHTHTERERLLFLFANILRYVRATPV